LVILAISCRLGSVDMENVLKSLKNAEERAAEVERQTAKKSSDLVKETEESMKQLEAEVEKKAKEAGERLLSTKLDNAKAESARIRDRARAEGAGMEKKAKEKMSRGVDKVVDAVVERMKSGE
jgi:vacuolar-type H+-ATPase subunit H